MHRHILQTPKSIHPMQAYKSPANHIGNSRNRMFSVFGGRL
jgi:hypothetical protein